MKFSWIGFKTIMMKPFTNFKHLFPVFQLSHESFVHKYKEWYRVHN